MFLTSDIQPIMCAGHFQTFYSDKILFFMKPHMKANQTCRNKYLQVVEAKDMLYIWKPKEFICKNTVTEKVKTSVPKTTNKKKKTSMNTTAAPSEQ